MLRMLFTLCLFLFISMLVLGQDKGQRRLGLTSAGASAPARSAALTAPPAQAARPALPAAAPDFAPAKPLITAAAPAPAPAETATADTVTAALPADPAGPPPAGLMYVTARSANLRQGPGKGHAVLARLARGEAAIILQLDPDPMGWSHIRLPGTRDEGYIQTRLLSETAP